MTGLAAAYVELPVCLAVIVVEPPSFKVTIFPEIVAILVFAIVKEGVNPDDAEPDKTKVP